jgi:hypothetical protein
VIALGLTLLCATIGLGADEIPSTPAKVSVVAVQGLKEAPQTETRGPAPRVPQSNVAPNSSAVSKRFGPGLENVQRALEGLSYKTFRRIDGFERSAKYQSESAIRLNDRYTLFVRPMSKDDQDRVRMNVRIEMAPRKRGDAPIDVVSDTSVALVPGKQVNLGGLKLDEGELIVVLWVRE